VQEEKCSGAGRNCLNRIIKPTTIWAFSPCEEYLEINPGSIFILYSFI